MIAITLAAGMGTRMKEMCSNKPKVMIDFLGKTLLERQQKIFFSKKIKHYLVSGYCSDAISDFPKSNQIENKNFQTTNMVYSLLCAKDFFQKNEDIIVSYGDIIFQDEVLENLLNVDNGDIQVCVDRNFMKLWQARMENPIDDLESFNVDKAGYISDLGSKLLQSGFPSAQYIGLFKIKAHYLKRFTEEYLNLLVSDVKYQQLAMTNFLQHLIAKNAKIFPVYINGGWLEFDSVQDFASYSEMYLQGNLSAYYVD